MGKDMFQDTAHLFYVQQKITLEDLSESKSTLEDKSADRSHSVNSMQTATHETTNVAVYEVGMSQCCLNLCKYSKVE